MRKEFTDAVRKNLYEITDDQKLYLPRQKLLIGGKFGSEVWRNGECIAPYEEAHNVVVDEGLDHILNAVFYGETQVSTWYVGIYNTNTAIDGSTLTGANVHSTLTESNDYDTPAAPNRPSYAADESTAQSMTNSAKATFTMSATTTIYGAFLISTQTRQDSAGILMAASAFTSSRSLADDDDLLVTYTVNATST